MKKVLTNYAAFAGADLVALALCMALLFGFCTARKAPIFAPQSTEGELTLNTTADSVMSKIEANLCAWDSQFKREYNISLHSLKNNRPVVVKDAVLDTNIVKRK